MVKIDQFVNVTITRTENDGSVADALNAPMENPYTDMGQGAMKAALEREGYTDVTVSIREELVTITKAQLRKLVGIVATINCPGCGWWWEDGHDHNCTFEPELSALEELCK